MSEAPHPGQQAIFNFSYAAMHIASKRNMTRSQLENASLCPGDLRKAQELDKIGE